MSETQRIDDLEIKVTYLEDAIRTLNGVIIEQNNRIDQLHREIERLTERDSDEARPIEKPPHY